MKELPNVIATGFISSYGDFAQRVHALAERLTEEQFWKKPYSYGNSVGHLTLHLIGNLNYYIGAQIANTGYVRDREREFTDDSRPTKAEVLRRLDETVDLVIATLEEQSAESWPKAYQADNLSDYIQDRFSVFLRCATHFHHHFGQMTYLEKELSK